MNARKSSRPCEKPDCHNWAMLDGSGFCFIHNPALADKRREVKLKQAETLRGKVRSLPERRCGYSGCRNGTLYDGSGFCFEHSPTTVNMRRETHKKQGMARRSRLLTPERRCAIEGCRNGALYDGSGFCYNHNPALEEKRRENKLKNIPTPERTCTFSGCQKWSTNDGSGLCNVHHPAFIEGARHRMKGKKNVNKGRHLPWLGLENIEEARGLIFYSLENDKPLLTLRALTKIASLHKHGLMGMPKRRTENVERGTENVEGNT